MARKTKEEAEKTRNAILDAAEQVFFKRGVVRTSLQEIASAAGVTRGAVYWHFRNKIELVKAMTERVILPQEYILEKMEGEDSPKPLGELHRICRENLQKTISDQQRLRVFTILMRKCEYVEEMAGVVKSHTELRERILARFLNIFEKARKLKQLNPEWHPRIAAVTLHNLMLGILFNLVADEKSGNKESEKNVISCLAAFFKTLETRK